MSIHRRTPNAVANGISNHAGQTVEKFVTTWTSALHDSATPIDVEHWHRDASHILVTLRKVTAHAKSTNSLKLASDAWLKLSRFLKMVVLLDHDPHLPGFVEEACNAWWDCVTAGQ